MAPTLRFLRVFMKLSFREDLGVVAPEERGSILPVNVELWNLPALI